MNAKKKSTYDSENLNRVQYISEFLKNYRILSGITQGQLSIIAELDRSTIIRLESGTPVSFLTICKYASGLDLNLHHLFHSVL